MYKALTHLNAMFWGGGSYLKFKWNQLGDIPLGLRNSQGTAIRGFRES